MMTPIAVLRCLYRDHNRYFRQVMALNKGQARTFQKVLGSTFRDSDISKLLSGETRVSSALLEAMNTTESLRGFSSVFGWDIAACGDTDDIELHVVPRPVPQASNVRCHRRSEPSIEPNQAEADLLSSYASRICDLRTPVCYDFSDHECGIVALTPIMMETDGFSSTYESIAYIHSYGPDDCFEIDLKSYLRSRGVQPSMSKIEEVVDVLHASNDLVVLSGTRAFDVVSDRDSRHFVPMLLSRLDKRARDQGWDRGPVVLACGPSKVLKGQVSRTDAAILGDHARRILDEREANGFLVRQWLRFCRLRDRDPYAAPGSRLTRAQWHYRVAHQSGYSINIRARAFFASNADNMAFFDPTGGFRSLAGMADEDLPIDMYLFKRTVQSALDIFLRFGGDDAALRLFRYVSTSKHWLTKQMSCDLARRYKPDGRDLSTSFTLPSSKELSEMDSRWRHWIHYDAQAGRYSMSIVAKALIQDEWRRKDTYDRRIAHYRVARRIWNSRDDKRFLSTEFPYKPHWGRYRIHLLTEVIRHLVRACDVGEGSSWGSEDAEDAQLEGELIMPRAPSDSQDDGFSRAAVMFCFRLFDEELNGNKYSPNARALTRRHGAYALAKEVLQLISDAEEGFGNVPGCMHPRLRTRFTAECGYAALSLGELDLAETCFTTITEGKTDADHLAVLMAHLDRSLVKTAGHELDEAECLIEDAEKELKEGALDPKGRAQLRRRVTARRLQVRFHSGEQDLRSVAHEFDLYNGERQIKEIELLRCFILAMAAVAEVSITGGVTTSPLRGEVLARCMSDAFTKASDGQHHDAMTLKILLAGLMRRHDPNYVMVAEAMLDQVYQDIVSYGCAEVTLIRFLLEAGENLVAQGRGYRAYCVYIRRCHRRARARRFVREAAQAAALGAVVLSRLRMDLASFEARDMETMVGAEIEFDRSYLNKNTPSLTKEAAGRKDEFDPLYGFSMADDHGEERWLRSVEDVDRELGELHGNTCHGAAPPR